MSSKPRETSPSPGLSRSPSKSKKAGSSPSKDCIPNHYFTPRKAFSQEVASSPLISDLEMDTLTAECGDILNAVASMTSEEESSPVKMGPPSCQKYQAGQPTPNTKMLLEDLACSESERDTPFKKDSPKRPLVTSRTPEGPPVATSSKAALPTSKESSQSRVSSTPSTSKSMGTIPRKTVSIIHASSSSSEEEETHIASPSGESSGDELNIYSSNFDPKKAFSMGHRFLRQLPFPFSKKLKSLEQYKRIADKAEKDDDFEKHMIRVLRPNKRRPKEAAPVRKFLPEQGPVAGTSRNKETESYKNILSRMECYDGPIAKLAEYKEKKIRVMVKTRNLYQGTNDMLGYVAAFDKHWNIALVDVEETFIRKRRRKVPVSLGETVKLSDEELERRGVVRPKVIKRMGKNSELCKRHIPQLMLRGEQVVVIFPVV